MPTSSVLNAVLSLKGQKQGEIRGSATQKGREGRLLVLAAQHELTSPRDAATGQATGRRMHKPFTIVKEVDASTPRLYAALAAAEPLTAWELQCWGTSELTGESVLQYVVRLFNASVVGIRFIAGDCDMPGAPGMARHTSAWTRASAFEEVSFTYQRIEWTWAPTGLASGDDWVANKDSSAKAPTKTAPLPTAQRRRRPVATSI